MTIRGYISTRRRRPLIRFVARQCGRFLRCYENADDHNFDTNGERLVLRAMAKNDFPVIFDVGANIGAWALMAHDIFPTSTIHCFEIMRSTCENLSRQTHGIAQIMVNQYGLSDEEADVPVRHYPTMPVLSTVTQYPHDLDYVEDTGHVTTGDAYMDSHGIGHVDFVKIDVEGAENSVLRGFSRAFAAGKIDVVQFEYGQVSVVTRFMLRDFFAFFAQYGYIVGKIYPNYVDFRDYDFGFEDFNGCNYLAVSGKREDLISLLT